MKYLNIKDDINELESGVKNKFRWEWLENDDAFAEKISVWCKKIDDSGKCFCTCCNTSIRYGSEGFKALVSHSRTESHQKARKSVRNTQYLQSFSCISGDFPSDRTVDLATRKCRSEALITSFIAEHSLPFSLAPEILELSKFLAKDVTALNSLQMSRITAAYKLKYGLAKTVQEEQFSVLGKTYFSLNVDESTNKAHESILSILVQYYCDIEQKILLRHLTSVKLDACTSNNIFRAIVSVVEENNIPWNNLVSVLMDSCNTMRGVKNGVEVQIRKKKAPHLLDIDGDTCHTVNNCAKMFTIAFKKYIELLCDNIYFDLKSSDKRALFFKLCTIIGVKPLKPLSRPEHRWLYVLNVIERLEYLWDALILFYFSWLPKEDSEIFKDDVKFIMEKQKLSVSHEAALIKIQSTLKKKSLTEDGRRRKQMIIKKLFEKRKKTLLHFGIYKAVLPQFNCYLKLFQKKSVALHLIHVELNNLTKQFLAFFIKHEVISEADNYENLLKIDVKDSKNYLPDNLIFTGTDVSKIINDSKKKDPKIEKFQETLKSAYSKCAAYMLQKLPLKKSSLIKFTGLDPDLRGSSTVFTALVRLGQSLPNVISENEISELDKEVRLYQIDSCIGNILETDVESFWTAIFRMKQNDAPKYPCLTKLIKAVLTCFHGPHVESTFNFMGNIMTSNRTSLNTESLDSVQTVKYFLLSKNKNTCDVFGSKLPMEEPIEKSFAENLMKSRSFYQQTLDGKNKVTADMSDKEHMEDTHETNKEKISNTASPCVSSAIPSSSGSVPVKRSHSPEKIIKTKQTKIAHFFKK